MISIKDILELNKKFDKGNLVNRSTLEFAISSLKYTKDPITQIAYLIRSITVDHAFEEGCKRTALILMIAILRDLKKTYDQYKAEKVIANITKKHITDIKKIREMIKNVIK